MRRERLDADGYILPEADLANVQPEYAAVPGAAGDLLAEAFGERLHSGYMYGSIVRGNAVPGRSDADLVAVLHAPPADRDRHDAAEVEKALQQRFPVLFGAEVALAGIDLVHSPVERYGFQVFLRELSVCVHGPDLRPELPRTKPSAALALGFHEDTPELLARARAALRAPSDPEAVRRVCRGASRRMVQGAFALVMAADGSWETVLEEQAAAVGAAFPEWTGAAREAAAQGRLPVARPEVVAELLETFGRWVEAGLNRVRQACRHP